MNTNNKKEHLIMDERNAPYADNENPFPRTQEDDDFDKMIMEKYHLKPREKQDASA